MDQDEKTARGHRSPAVRSTAPAGTPYPVAPNPPPAVPPPTASQPRTVGGHTARLLVQDENALDFDPLGSSSNPEPLPAGPRDGSDAAPISTTMGGTQRLQQLSPEEAAQLQDSLDREEPGKKPAGQGGGHAPGRRPPAPTVDMEPVAPPATVKEPAGPPAKTEEPAKPSKPARTDDDGPSTLSLLFAPASVAVGLVFFAMGSMITLTAEGRLIRLTVSVPGMSASLPAPSAPDHEGAATGPTHTAGHPPVSSAPSTATTAGGAPSVSTGKGAPGTARPQGSGKRPPIIF